MTASLWTQRQVSRTIAGAVAAATRAHLQRTVGYVTARLEDRDRR